MFHHKFVVLHLVPVCIFIAIVAVSCGGDVDSDYTPPMHSTTSYTIGASGAKTGNEFFDPNKSKSIPSSSNTVNATCSLDEVALEISCQGQKSSSKSQLNWLEDNTSRSSTDDTFIFKLKTPIQNQVTIQLEECIDNTCNETKISIDTSSISDVSKSSESSPPEPLLSQNLGANCELDSQNRKILCQAQRTSIDSTLLWTYQDKTSKGNTFEFEPYDDVEPQTIVILKECINSQCEEFETRIDTSSLVSRTGKISNAKSEKRLHDEIMTMQSEYSRGKCNPSGIDYLDFPPMNPDEIAVLRPMGGFGGNHITPIDHMYIHYEPETSHDVYSMGDGHIVHVGHTGTDHRIIIEYSCNLYSIYIHIHELDGSIESQLDWVNPEGVSKGRSYSRIPVKSGMIIGRQIRDRSFDLSVVDTRITLGGFANLESYRGEFWKQHCVDPFDYWEGSFRQTLLEKTIISDSKSPGGKIDYDVDGKLVGNWFEKGTGGYEGVRSSSDTHGISGHLSFAYHNLSANTIVISLGMFAFQGPMLYGIKGNSPDPATIGIETGLVKFELLDLYRGEICCDSGFVIAGTGERWHGNIYPDGGLIPTFRTEIAGVVLVEILDNQTIQFESFSNNDSTNISEFTNQSKIYAR